MEGLDSSQTMTLYTMFGFVAILAFVMVITAINSYRVSKELRGRKTLKLRRLELLRESLLNREIFEGYMSIQMPDEHKSLFQDILKGFEEFMLLKGYKVIVSVNSSEKNKILVKIDFVEHSPTKNESEIRIDLEEYISRIKNGEMFDDMPRVLDPIQHERINLALRMRISFLQQNYEIEKNVRLAYEKMFDSIGLGSGNPTTINVVGMDNSMDKRKYISNDSKNLIQGDVTDSTNNLGSRIRISGSFNEKKTQIEGLKELVAYLREDGPEGGVEAARAIDNAIEELEEEENPDLVRVEKWLEKSRRIISLMDKTCRVFIKASGVFKLFGINL